MCWAVDHRLLVLLLACVMLFTPFPKVSSLAQFISQTYFNYVVDPNHYLFYGIAAFFCIYIFIGNGVHIHVWHFVQRLFYSIRRSLEQVERSLGRIEIPRMPYIYWRYIRLLGRVLSPAACLCTFVRIIYIHVDLAAFGTVPVRMSVITHFTAVVAIGIIFTIIAVLRGTRIQELINFILFLSGAIWLIFPYSWTEYAFTIAFVIFVSAMCNRILSQISQPIPIVAGNGVPVRMEIEEAEELRQD